MSISPKSLRTLRNELVGPRLAAGQSDLWTILATVNERALIAINDAIRSYPFWINSTASSLYIDASKGVVSLPQDVSRITSLRASSSTAVANVEISDFRIVPSQDTMIVHVSLQGWPAWLEVEYEHRVAEFPEATVLAQSYSGTVAAPVRVTAPGMLPTYWPPVGWAELYHQNSAQMEVVYYNSINPTVGLNVVQRGCFGTQPRAWVQSGTVVNPVVVIPPESLAPIMAQAEANMFNFWISHRSLYDTYSTIVAEAKLTVEELLTMIRTREKQAENLYNRVKYSGSRSPARAQVGRRRDI